MNKPTEKQYGAYQYLYDYLNETLFDGQLPACMLVFSVKKNKTAGYFSSKSWQEKRGFVHEISLNPEYVKKHSLKETLAVLSHQMVHLWQYENGKASRKGYHNREWAEKMKTIRLIPSDSGEVGGKETGQQMKQYVEKGGKFEKAYEEIAGKYEIPFHTFGEEKKGEKEEKERERYVCKGCGWSVWSKGGLEALCGKCGIVFENEQRDVPLEIENRVYELLKVKYGG